MLSRVAERMYWFGRYIERAENTARLISVNANLLLDLPRMSKHIWGDLINITGYVEEFYDINVTANETNVIKFLLAEPKNPGSLICSSQMIRENVRTTREVMPSEAWEQINEFHLYVKKNVNKALRRDGRHDFLDDVIMYCHQLTGMMIGNMSHGDAYNFMRIGKNLERADMTTRIIDVGCINLLQGKDDIPETYENTLWMNVLRSLSAYQMYRQHVADRVNSEDVVEFLLKNEAFPRAVAHCLHELNICVTQLPRNDHPLRSITYLQRNVTALEINKLLENNLHDLIDDLQLELSSIHDQVGQTWFGYALEPEETRKESN